MLIVLPVKSTFLQLLLELFDLLLELAQQCVLWVLVDAGLVLDVLGPVGIPQRTDGLVIVVICRPDVGTLADTYGWRRGRWNRGREREMKEVERD